MYLRKSVSSADTGYFWSMFLHSLLRLQVSLVFGSSSRMTELRMNDQPSGGE